MLSFAPFFNGEGISMKCMTTIVMIALCSGSLAQAESWKTIKTEADFRSKVVGQNLVWNGNSGIINADGTAKGKLAKHGKYYGKWVWSGRFYCRNFVINGKESGTNCAKVQVSGSGVRFVNDKGKGRVTTAAFD